MRRVSGIVVLMSCLGVLMPVSGSMPPVSADEGDFVTIGGGGTYDPTSPDTTNGDGGPAVGAALLTVSGLAVEPSGGVLVADNVGQIRRIRADGTIEVVAGSVRGFAGDGGPAAAARLSTPGQLAVDPTGGFAVIDEGNHRVRKVSPDGTIDTIVGNGDDVGSFVAGSPATSVPVSAGNIAYAPDGRLYFTTFMQLWSLDSDGRIRAEGGIDPLAIGMAFSPNGTLFSAVQGTRIERRDGPSTWTVIAGSTAPSASSADGIAATDARMRSVYDIAVGPNGDLFLADNGDGRVRRVRNGIITTVAGGGTTTDATGCLPATRATSVPASKVEVRPNGAVVVVVGSVVREIQVAGQTCPSITSVAPTRVLETRASEGQIGYSGPTPIAGQVVRLSFAGSPVVPTTARAVALNVTVTGSSRDGFVTIWPCEESVPNASNVNVTRGGTAANAALVKLGASLELCLLDQAGGDLLVDVTGYVGSDVPFIPFVPYRALETRPEVGRFGYQGGKPVAGQTVRVTMSGFGYGSNRVPVDASAVVVNVTAVDATADGFVTVWSCQGPPPTASNINVSRGGTVGRMVIAALGTTATPFGTSREICLFTQSGAHLLVDVLGALGADAPYLPLTPDRVLETRPEVSQIGYVGARPGAGQVVEIDVLGRSQGRVPADARAVVLSLTATNPAAPGFVTAWPCGSPRPLASSLNLAGPDDTQSNAVVVGLGAGGKVCVFTQTGTDLVADVNGVFV